MVDNRPLPLTGEDWFRATATRIDRLERRTGNMLTPDLLGPGIASMAVQIIDWNALEVTFNGFFYSNAGLAINSPDPEVSWTGQTIAKDDGSGMQQVWSTDTPIYWVRNYAPNPEPGGQPVFGPWQRFASEGGTIPTEVLAFSWEDGDAYTLTTGDVAAGVFQFGLTYYPHLESVHAAWGGVIQHPDEYGMNYSTATVTWPLTGFEEAGDVFWFHYTHDKRLRPPDPPCTPLAGLVARGIETYSGPLSAVPLPAGTEPGDLITVIAHGPNDGGSNYPPLGAGVMTDARMDNHYAGPTSDHWWGNASNLADISVAIPTGGTVVLATFGDTGSNAPLIASEVVAVSKSEYLGNGGEPISIAGLEANGVVVLSNYDHGSGSDNPISLEPDYTDLAPVPDATARCGGIHYWTGTGTSPDILFTVVSAYQRYDRTVIALAVNVEGCVPEPEPPPDGGPCYVNLIDSFANPPLSHYRLGDTATGVLTDRVGGEHGTADTLGAVAGLLVGDPDGGHQPNTAATACQVTDSTYLNPTLTGFTLSCLVNLDSVTTGDVILVSRESGVIEWRLCLNDGKPRLQIRASGGTFYTATSTTVLTTDTTYHITGEWKGGGLTVTANDSVVATVSTGATSAITDQTGAPLRIGSYGSTLQVAGTVDEVIIWGPSGPTTEELASLTACALGPAPLDGLLCAEGPYVEYASTEPTFTGTANTVLGDGSDATYLVWGDSTGYFNYGLEALDGGIDPEAYTLVLRMMSDAVDAVDTAVATMEVYLSTTNANTVDEFAGFSDGAVSGFGFNVPSAVFTGGVPVDVEVPLSLTAWSPTVLADVTAALQAGAFLVFNNLTWVDGDTPPAVRIYSACINYTGPAPDPGEEPPPPVGDGPYVTPLASKAVHEGYGICQHVNFQSDNIHAGATNQAAILDRYGSMHAHQMRSMYNPNTSAAFLAAIDGCREHGVKWNALVAARQDNGTISPSEATIRSRITKMATDHADVIGWIEGINEPNEPSDPNWVDDVLYAQWVIWDEWSQHPELAHVKILSPSMHDTRLDASDGAHWDMYANGEITVGGDTFTGKDLCHMAAVHSYPAGNLPDTNRADRVQWVYDAFGAGFPIKFTEWGYTNALGTPRVGGHKVANEASAAAYSAQAILDFANNEWELLQYEMMDDPNSANNDTEKNFGQYRVQSNTGAPNTTWTAKPSVAAITAVLSALEDPGSDYVTGDVTLDLSDVPSGVRTCVTQKRDGTTTLWLWRHQAMWNANTETPITVGTVSVPITDIAGLRNITVGVAPVAVNVRLVP